MRPPSSGGFGTPGTPNARGPASRQSYQPAHQAQAHEEHGSPLASTSSTHASPQSAASSTSVKVGRSSQRPASASQSHMFSNANTCLHSILNTALRIRPPPSPEAASSIPPRFQRSVVHPVPESATQLVVEGEPLQGYMSKWQMLRSSTVATPAGGKAPHKQAFTFDSVLGSSDGQIQIYETVEPLVGSLAGARTNPDTLAFHRLVQRFLEGYNVTVLAYGQTSSGTIVNILTLFLS